MKQVIRRIAAGLLSAGLLLSFTPRARQIAELPSEIVLPAGQAGALSELLPFQPLQSAYTAAAASYDEQLAASGESQVTLSMLGVPVKRVTLSVTQERRVVPGGHSIGVALRTQGVLVVGVSDINTESGAVCPARSADLRAGESIDEINGQAVNSVDEFTQLLAQAGGEPVEAHDKRRIRYAHC